MKKKDAQNIGILILIILILRLISYPFVWLYEQVGSTGIVATIILALISIAVFVNILRKRDEHNFNKLVIFALNNKMSPVEAKEINIRLSKSNFPRAALIRRLQIIRDSIDISLASKKRDTAESRFSLVMESYKEIVKEHSHLIKPETMNAITNVVYEAENTFHTNLYRNTAIAHLDKVKKLKTIKSKRKYIQLAKDTLNEGLANSKSDSNILNYFMIKVLEKEQDVENGIL